jgi:hypothetical protein
MAHHCPAPGCRNRVAPPFYICSVHWLFVPTDLRDSAQQTLHSFFYSQVSIEELAKVQAELLAAVKRRIAELEREFDLPLYYVPGDDKTEV